MAAPNLPTAARPCPCGVVQSWQGSRALGLLLQSPATLPGLGTQCNALCCQSSPQPHAWLIQPQIPVGLPCPVPKCHHGKETHAKGRRETDSWESLHHLPGLELRALQGWILQHRTEAVGGCPSLPVPSLPRAQSDTNPATSQCSQHQELVFQAQHLQISSHRPKSCCEHQKAQLSPA